MCTKTTLSISGLILLLVIGCSFIPRAVIPTDTPTELPTTQAPVPPVATSTEAPTMETPQVVEGLGGTYTGGGTNPDGSAYRVQVIVEELNGYYSLVWSNGTSGYGLRRGDFLAASFGGKQCGIVIYSIESDYSLSGDWLTLNQSLGSENATPKNSRNVLDGDFNILGTNPDGGTYHGTMTLTPRGDVWRAIWYVPNEVQGIGVTLENTLAITYGGSGCGVVSYRIASDGTLDGLWGWFNTSSMGTETVSK